MSGVGLFDEFNEALRGSSHGYTTSAPLTLEVLNKAFDDMRREEHEQNEQAAARFGSFWATVPESLRADEFMVALGRLIYSGAPVHPADHKAIMAEYDRKIAAARL